MNQSQLADKPNPEEVTGHEPLCSPDQTDEETAEGIPQRPAELLGRGSSRDPDRGKPEGV